MDNVYIGNSFAFHGHSPLITGYSVFQISKVNAVCDRFCISFEGGISVQTYSAFIVDFSSASADGHDLLYVSGAITVGDNSLFMQKDNYFITPRYAFSVDGGWKSSGGSVISFVNNNLLGHPWHGGGCSGTCYAQCNALGMAQLSTTAQYVTAGISGLSAAYPCNLRTSCPDTAVGCFLPYTDATVAPTAGKCCTCKPGGYGPYCLPVEWPFVPLMCIETLTIAVNTETRTSTLSEAMTMSPTKAWKQYTGAKLVSSSVTLSEHMSGSDTLLSTDSQRLTLSKSLHPLSPTPLKSRTRTLDATPSETQSLSRAPSSSHTASSSPSQSQSLSENITDSYTVTDSPTETVSGSITSSETLTLTLTSSTSFTPTPSETETITDTLGYCTWDRSAFPNPMTYAGMQTSPIFPLAITQNTVPYNFTMAVPYADAFNGYRFTLSSLGQWKVDSVAFTGETTFVLYENKTTSDSAVISVGPPSQRYTNILLRTAMISVTFRCATTWYTETFQIVILPEEPVVQEGVVNDVLAAALASGIIVASPPVAAAAAWAMIFMQLMLCKNRAENSAISFTGLTIGSDGLRYLRGAIVANLLIVLGQVVMVMLIGGIVVAVARSKDPKQRFLKALSVLQWPNVMHISIGALMLLTMTASVALLSDASTPEDFVLGLIGGVGCLLYTINICYRLYVAHQQTKGANKRWQIAQSLGSKSFVFGNYKRPWFAGYETANNLVMGIIAGLPSGTTTICTLQMWAIWVLSLIIICVIVFYRPMKTLLSLAFVLAIQVLTFMAANAMLVAHYVPSSRSKAFGAASLIVLVIPLAALLKGITDIVAFVMHGRALFDELFAVDLSIYDFDSAEEEPDEELKPTQEVEAKELSEFLLAIDATTVVKKKRGAAQAEAPSSGSAQAPADYEAPLLEEALDENDIFSSLKI